MKKSDLKQLIKPLVKECIHEVLLEEGLLSNVVSEVAKGLQATPLVESQQSSNQGSAPSVGIQATEQGAVSRSQLKEYRKKMMEAVGKDAYNGVDLFENTAPLSNRTPGQGSADLGEPGDAGVDISSLVGNSSKIWQALK
jgi:hypothetical protein